MFVFFIFLVLPTFPSVLGSCPGLFQCAECTTSACTKCNSGFFLLDGSCVNSCDGVSSTESYYVANGVCLLCHASCNSCTGPGTGDCITCRTGHGYLFQGACLGTCPLGYYGTSDPFKGLICSACISNCGICNATTDCLSCSNNTYYNAATKSCVSVCGVHRGEKVGLNGLGGVCVDCDDQEDCLRCSDSVAGACVSCNTTSSLFEAGFCVGNCSAGYFPASSTLCQDCHSTVPHCADCSQNGTYCFLCDAGYFQTSNTSCAKLTDCDLGVSYESVAPTSSSDRICSLCSSCFESSFASAACSLLTNTVCDPCTTNCSDLNVGKSLDELVYLTGTCTLNSSPECTLPEVIDVAPSGYDFYTTTITIVSPNKSEEDLLNTSVVHSSVVSFVNPLPSSRRRSDHIHARVVSNTLSSEQVVLFDATSLLLADNKTAVYRGFLRFSVLAADSSAWLSHFQSLDFSQLVNQLPSLYLGSSANHSAFVLQSSLSNQITNIVFSNQSFDSFVLSWKTTTLTPPLKYRVFFRPKNISDPLTPFRTLDTASSGTSVFISNLTSGTFYDVRIVPVLSSVSFGPDSGVYSTSTISCANDCLQCNTSNFCLKCKDSAYTSINGICTSPSSSSASASFCLGGLCDGAVYGIIAGVALIILGLLVLIFCRPRSKPNKVANDSSTFRSRIQKKLRATPSWRHLPVDSRQRLTQTNPLTINSIVKVVQNTDVLKYQYSSVPDNYSENPRIPPNAEKKNRFKDILPNYHSRVQLSQTGKDPASKYINANYIRGWDDQWAYIASQAPTKASVEDFWRMIWEEGIESIVMVTGLIELGKVKCERYWPTNLRWREVEAPHQGETDLSVPERQHIYGLFSVTLVEEREDAICTTTKLKLSNGLGETREVTHFWMTTWLDRDVPSSPKNFLAFLARLQGRTESYSPPLLVHCSGGVGRTGTLIAAHSCMSEYINSKSCDILKALCSMRQDRGGMIQSFAQFLFVHEALKDFMLAHESRTMNRRNPASTSSVVFNPLFLTNDTTFLDLDEEDDDESNSGGVVKKKNPLADKLEETPNKVRFAEERRPSVSFSEASFSEKSSSSKDVSDAGRKSPFKSRDELSEKDRMESWSRSSLSSDLELSKPNGRFPAPVGALSRPKRKPSSGGYLDVLADEEDIDPPIMNASMFGSNNSLAEDDESKAKPVSGSLSSLNEPREGEDEEDVSDVEDDEDS